MALQAFVKWAIDFVGPIKPPWKKIGARYIITATDYVTRWVEAEAVKDCTIDTDTHFIFEQILTRFGCSKILMSDRGTHFVNETIPSLTEDLWIHNAKSTLFHP